MCGFAGVVRSDDRPVTAAALRRMAGAIRHRGPDGWGYYRGPRCGLAHVRLSIIDIAGGAQPMTSEDGRLIVVYNGEVYNYRELKEELEALGHVFRTRCDTEVLVHGYEAWGAELMTRLNGQFAFAMYDRAERSLFLARDRFGVRPLFYAERDGSLYVGSEAKAIFAGGEVQPEIDYRGIDEVFTFWAARPPRTPFRGVRSLEPGSYAIWLDGHLRVQRYYDLAYAEQRDEPVESLRELDSLMRDSVALRMRADVPVGGYLSGGLDSSITCALATKLTPHRLRTFSVTFDDPTLDESTEQRIVASELESLHNVQAITTTDIASVFPDVIWHTETPLLRTAPAPMFLLSKLTRENGIKVVLTGEGSDELFLGYDLFKETAVRQFCLRQPQSTARRRLFDRLYPYLPNRARGGELWQTFFLSAGPLEDPLFSHLPRFKLASWSKRFYSDDMRCALSGHDALHELRESLPSQFARWSSLNRAAYLEMTTLLSPYLLSSQGDRVALAHGVEGRFPFLDHRLFEFASRLPVSSKLCGLREKLILRQWASKVVPPSVTARHKQPYRAPDIPAFFDAQTGAAPYVMELLEPDALRQSALFDAEAVAALVARCQAGRASSARESQALVGILSTQLWYRQFVDQPAASSETRPPDVALDETVGEFTLDLIPAELR